MSTMYQEYRDRVHFKGKTKRDYVNTKVSESIDSLIQDSQYGFKIEKDGQEYDVAILSTKTSQDYERANVIAHNNVGLDKGSLFKWNGEYWIILQKMFRPEQPGFNGNAYKCTGTLKWIDKNGVLQERPGYISSGRTTNSLTYTPDVNYKYRDIVLHDTDWSMIAAVQQDLTLHTEMRFIIKGQAYRVTNVDNVSIDNVSILSMVNDKLLDSDDVINGIATSDLPAYSFRYDVQLPINLYAGDIKEIPVSVVQNGHVVDEDIIFESLNPEIVEISDNKLIGRGIGTATIRCHLAKNKYIYDDGIIVSVSESHIPDVEEVYIEGPDFIEWNSKATYRLTNGADTQFEVEYFSRVKHTEEWGPNYVTISIQDKWAGNIVISCELNGKTIHKEVIIKTL